MRKSHDPKDAGIPIMNTMPIEQLRQHFSYDPAEGVVRKIGEKSKNSLGYRSATGYIRMEFGSLTFAAHRIAWALHYGEWPELLLDHKNLIKHDNRICNLRPATSLQNAKAKSMLPFNTTGFKGVSMQKGKYLSRIWVDNASHRLGGYECPIDAGLAYDRAAIYFHGDFAVTNFSLGLI